MSAMATMSGMRSIAARQSIESRNHPRPSRDSQDNRSTTLTTNLPNQVSESHDAPELPIRSPISSQLPSKMGILAKRTTTTVVSSWKDRFFVLSEGYLSYYKKSNATFFSPERDQKAYLKGGLQLTPDAHVQKCDYDERINCFEIFTLKKKIVVQASSTKEADGWIKCIEAHIASISPSSSASPAPAPSPIDVPLPQPIDDVKHSSDHHSTKQCILQHLLDENQKLRDMLQAKDKLLRQLDLHTLSSTQLPPSNGSFDQHSPMRPNRIPQNILDLKTVREKQIQLFDATESNNHSFVTALLSSNFIDPNTTNSDQNTALHIASMRNHFIILTELLKKGADHAARNGNGQTPLHLSVQNRHYESVCALLEFHADVNAVDCYGNAAIHMAAERADVHITQKLIANGANCNLQNASGTMAIHLTPIGHPIRVLLSQKSLIPFNNSTHSPLTQLTNTFMDKDRLNLDSNAIRDNATQFCHIAFQNKYQHSLAVTPRDFEFIKVLGRGAFAKVYMVRGRGHNREKYYALKAYSKQAILQKNQAQYIYTEKKALQACSDHPYIVTLYYAFQSTDRLFLVMEYCGGGDLLSVLTRRRSFTEEEAAFYVGEIALALSHLHSKGIVFRDLKPENVVMDLEGHCLLTDFGISKKGMKEHMSANTFCGSPMYLAPEMLLRSGHTFALDWYSVGALLFELLTGLPPFYANNKKQLFQNILRGSLVIPEYLSEDARDLIGRLLERDPQRRLGSGKLGDREIFNHAFFKSIDWQKLRKRELEPPFRPKVELNLKSGPDTCNFPKAFTDQEITDEERGIVKEIENGEGEGKRQAVVFRNFDFSPDVDLDEEAKEFEKMVVLQEGGDGVGEEKKEEVSHKEGKEDTKEKEMIGEEEEEEDVLSL